jgi:ribosome modulation factor
MDDSKGDDPCPDRPTVDATAEGARARAQGAPREACPYALDSEKRHEWLEGYDGRSNQGSALMPEVKA